MMDSRFNPFDELEKLRDFAKQRDWGKSQSSLKVLFLHLGEPAYKSIAISWAERAKPNFEEDYTDPAWPTVDLYEIRQSLASALQELSFLNKSVMDLEHPIGPGHNNFGTAIHDLARMMLFSSLESRVEWAVSAITNVMMANLDRIWGTENLELWMEVMKGDYDSPRSHFWTDPKVIMQDIAQWLQLADEIEAAFRAGAH
jgi:hypothetical protein